MLTCGNALAYFVVASRRDNAGALLGPLLAALLVGVIGVRAIIGLAIIPGVLAAASITIAARQTRRTLAAPTARTRLSLNLREMRQAGIVRALAPAAAFELGNLAATLLILRATDLLQDGRMSLTTATSLAIVLYAGHNAVAALAAVGGGTLTDRIGPRAVFAGGAAAYLVAYALFAVGPDPWPWLLAGFALAGLGIGLAETAQSATVALLLPDRLRGTGFGALGLVQAFGDLGASLVAGLLWAAGLADPRLRIRGRLDDRVPARQPPRPAHNPAARGRKALTMNTTWREHQFMSAREGTAGEH